MLQIIDQESNYTWNSQKNYTNILMTRHKELSINEKWLNVNNMKI